MSTKNDVENLVGADDTTTDSGMKAEDSSSTENLDSTVSASSASPEPPELPFDDPGMAKPKTPEEPAKRGRGRPKGSGKKPAAIPSRESLADVGNQQQAVINTTAMALAAGDVTASLIETICGGVFGAAWKMRPEERENMGRAWATYFIARGIPAVPPEVVVIGALAAYATPRLTDDTTTTRLGKAWLWVRSKLGK